MDVIEMAVKIVMIADSVFPKSPLPHAPFRFHLPPPRNPLARFDSSRKGRLYQPPTSRVIAIVRRHCLNTMQVIRQYNDSIDPKGALLFDDTESIA